MLKLEKGLGFRLDKKNYKSVFFFKQKITKKLFYNISFIYVINILQTYLIFFCLAKIMLSI